MAEMHGKPVCPNHKVGLVDLPDPMKPKGTGVCPISGAHFDYEVDLTEMAVETIIENGVPVKRSKFKVTGDEKSN